MSQQPLTLTPAQRRQLQRLLRQTQDARLYRRTLAILEIARGTPIDQVARTLGVSRRVVYYWVEDYVGRHDPALVSLWLGSLWVYLTAPVLGACAGVLACRCVQEPGCCGRVVATTKEACR